MTDPASESLPAAIADEAARWVSESFDGGLDSGRRAALARWLDADPRHRRAYEEMQEIWRHMDAVPDTSALRSVTAAPFFKRRRSRRYVSPMRSRVRWRGPAIAACLAILTMGVIDDWPTRFMADIITVTGERRSIALADGSRLDLDTNSAVAFDFSAERRVVRLLRGEALFRVAPDPARPFMVEAGGGTATALGTAFLVRREADQTRVIVTEHHVRVGYGTEPVTAILAENETITYGSDGLGPVVKTNGGDAAAWADGVLIFKDAPLSEVVAAIGRYHAGYVDVTGDARNRRVSGVFRIDDPVAAFGQLERSLGLRSARLTDRLILIFA